MIRIHHDVVAELEEATEADGSNLVRWVHDLLALRADAQPMGWRVLPCGCLIIEPLQDAIANFSGRTTEFSPCVKKRLADGWLSTPEQEIVDAD